MKTRSELGLAQRLAQNYPLRLTEKLSQLRRRRISISIKLSIVVFVLIIGSVTIVTAQAIWREQQEFQDEIEQRAEVLLAASANVAADSLYYLDVDHLKLLAARTLEDDTVLAIRYYDAQGRVVAAPKTPELEHALTADPFGVALLAQQAIVMDQQSNRLWAGQRVTAGRQVLGAVSIELSTAGHNRTLRNMADQGFGVAIAAIIATWVLWVMISRWIIQPLESVLQAVNQYTAGELAQRININNQGEIGELAHAFNTMAETIQKREIELKQTNTQLSKEITERVQTEAQLKSSLTEREILIQEIHHRVKNNLQIISSLLMLQSLETQDEQTRGILRESQSRVFSIAAIHEALYQTTDLARVDFGIYIRRLLQQLAATFNIDTAVITPKTDIVDLPIELNQAIYCGLIVNELVSNALKYAFPHGRKGEILIDLQPGENQQLILTVQDNGIGLPADIAPDTTSSLGLRIVGMLTLQLDGQLTIERNNGTTFTFVFDRA